MKGKFIKVFKRREHTVPRRTHRKVPGLNRRKVTGKHGHTPLLWLPENSKVGQGKQLRIE